MKISRYFLYPNKSLLFLALYVFLSVVMMSFSDPPALRGVRWGLLFLSEKVSSVTGTFSLRKDLQQQNEYLVRENFDLRVQNQELREMVLENARLKRLLALKESGKHDYVSGRVIARGPEKNIGSVILNIGENDGVRVNMAVVNADGLVGKVFETTPNQSLVQLLTDRNAYVSAEIQSSGEKGTIAWTGNGIQLELQHILKNIVVEQFDVIQTSGMGGVFPRDIKIGIVSDIKDDERGMFRKIIVQPAVNFNALEEVFVIRDQTVETTAN